MSEDKRKKKQAYDYQLHKDTLERIVIQPRKEERLGERIAAAVAAGSAQSKTAYIIEAVKNRLEKDGF